MVSPRSSSSPDIRGHRSPLPIGPQVSERDARWQSRFRGEVEEDRIISFYHPDIRGHGSPSLVGPRVSELDVRWQVRFQDEVEKNRIISFYHQDFLMLLVHVDRIYPGWCPPLDT